MAVALKGSGRRIEWLAVMAGLLLLLAAAWLWWRSANAAAPYRYEMNAADAAAAGAAGASVGTLPLRSGRVLGAGDEGRVLADFDLAESQGGPVLMRWRPAVDGPFLHLQPDLDEVAALSEVLARHVAPDVPVLAWWDVSRQIGLLSQARPVFDAPVGEPLFVPAAWRAAATQVREAEAAFWGVPAPAAERERFERFVDALLMDEVAGMQALRALVPGGKAVLVLHVRDVILLGQMRPRGIGVALREFPQTGDVHGMVRSVRAWLSEHDYGAYTMMRAGDQPVRAVALTDVESGMTLAARLLPFIGNAQYDVPGATLVYRTGGFIVYEITPPGQTPGDAPE